MSYHIPFEVQIEIIKKLPIKSLIQFRSVSKGWKTLIDSSDFIVDYTVRSHAQPQHLLVRYENLSCEEVYVSLVDDDTFPQQKFSPSAPTSVNLFTYSKVIGASHGLVCVLGNYRNPGDFHLEYETEMAVVWNPFIRKSVAIAIPNDDWISLGFGVCPRTCDPKIVKIDHTPTHSKLKTVGSSSHWQVEVFSLSSGVWRTSIGNLSGELGDFKWPSSQVVINGTIYWFGMRHTVDGTEFYLISFDVSCEEFREIHLPFQLAFHDPMELFLCNRCDSVAVLKGWDQKYEVWMMENGDSKSFIKLFTVKMTDGNLRGISVPLGFRRNGELMMIIKDDADESAQSAVLVVYEPSSKHFNDIGIIGLYDAVSDYLFSVSPYTESLVLLDQ